MANIQTLLNNILKAVYGKDVRQSIHDAIKQCYYDGKVGAVDLTERERAAKAEKTINSRIDTILKGGTSSSDEVVDIRVDFDGKTHGSAGEAVRAQTKIAHDYLAGIMQKDGASNPFQPLMFDKYKYFHGDISSSLTLDVMEYPRFTLCDFDEYTSSREEVAGNTHSFISRLVNPIPAFDDFNGEYVAVIKSGKTFDNDVAIIFSSVDSWDPSVATFCQSTIKITEGYNVIPLVKSSYVNNEAEMYNYICFHGYKNLLADAGLLEIYIVKSDALIGWIDNHVKNNTKYIAPTANKFVWYGNNNTPTIKINGSKITATVPSSSSEDAIWRYTLVGYKLGKDIKGKKILIRTNSLAEAPMFGIGINNYTWRKKQFSVQNGECAVIDLESFIASNGDLSAHTGDYYVTMGKDFGTTTSIDSASFEFEIMILNDVDVIDPYEPFLGYTPDDFASATTSNYITCWGDSLTAGGGWTDRLATLSGKTVYNGGTGGENVKAIAARQGADGMIVNNITIPAGTTPVTIASRSTDGGIDTVFGHKVMPLLQGGDHVNPVKIGDVEGTLKWTGTNYADETGTWTFTRSVAGEAVTIDRETVIRTAFDREKNNPHLMVIFMGQNGGFSSNEDLINTHKLMINHAQAKHVVILGLSSGTEASRKDYETAMKYEFGRYFISLREYLSKYGLADAGLTPTSADTTAMAKGQVPPQLLTDGVHFTSATKTVIGNMLYKKCVELNIF